MKKLFLVLGFIATMVTSPFLAQAGEGANVIPLLPVKPIIDPEVDRPRLPIRPLCIGQDGHTLYFPDEMDYFVNLYTADGDNLTLEYSTLVSAEANTLLLPSYLQGTYVIEVIRGEQSFRGNIELD